MGAQAEAVPTGDAAQDRPLVVLVGPTMPRVVEGLKNEGARVEQLPAQEPERSTFLESVGPAARVAITSSFSGLDSSMFQHLPNLKLISNFGVGVDAIDVPKAHSLGIEVTNTPEVLTDDVADIALGLMLCVSRRLCASDRYVREHKWPSLGSVPLTSKFTGKTVGILGLGRIGLAIAKRAEAFDCKIAYWSRRPKDGLAFEYHGTPAALAKAVDYLVVACALTPETQGIVSREVMEALGPAGVLINIGRGGHVDEPAMVELLKDGRLGGAGLDVFADEPNVPEELLGLDRVVLLPHIGSNSIETRNVMADLVVENTRNFFQGKPLVTPVPKEH